jgi:Trk-type K+ transport system membrane component
MLKEHIHDLFTEGLGNIFFMKVYNLVNKIKNKTIKKILLGIHVVFYLLFLLLVAYVMFRLSFPL